MWAMITYWEDDFACLIIVYNFQDNFLIVRSITNGEIIHFNHKYYDVLLYKQCKKQERID